MADHIERAFPRLVSDNYSETSPPDLLYNCVGWTAGDVSRWWWPDDASFWPEVSRREWSLDGFVEAFATLGYEPCESDELEAGFEKVAIYLREDGRPTHMARQLPSGRWTSKLGESEDIEHASVRGLEGEIYGRCERILRRPVSL